MPQGVLPTSVWVTGSQRTRARDREKHAHQVNHDIFTVRFLACSLSLCYSNISNVLCFSCIAFEIRKPSCVLSKEGVSAGFIIPTTVARRRYTAHLPMDEGAEREVWAQLLLPPLLLEKLLRLVSSPRPSRLPPLLTTSQSFSPPPSRSVLQPPLYSPTFISLVQLCLPPPRYPNPLPVP